MKISVNWVLVLLAFGLVAYKGKTFLDKAYEVGFPRLNFRSADFLSTRVGISLPISNNSDIEVVAGAFLGDFYYLNQKIGTIDLEQPTTIGAGEVVDLPLIARIDNADFLGQIVSIVTDKVLPTVAFTVRGKAVVNSIPVPVSKTVTLI